MPGQVDPSSDTPVYRQIAAQLREAIRTGELTPGSPLPSESDLIAQYGAARGTVRQSLSVLKGEGLIVVARGRGAFVRDRAPLRRLSHDRFLRAHRDQGHAAFLAELKDQGREPEVEVLHVGPQTATSEVASRLGVRTGVKVLVRHRRYMADGHPVELATSYIPWKIAEGTEIAEPNPGPGGIYARLEELGHRLDHFTEEVTARMPLPEESRALSLGEGVPVFHLVRTAYGTDQALEVCDTIMAANSFVLDYRLPAD